MSRRISYSIICGAILLIFAAGCRPPQSDPLPEVSGGTAEVPVKGTESSTLIPVATQESLPTSTSLPTPPEGWVELPALDLGVSLYRPTDWEVIPFHAHKLDLRAPEGDGWVEVSKVDASNAQDWGAADQTWDAQSILTNLVTAAREDGEFADPMPLGTITGGHAWATQGINNVIGDRLWFGVIGLNEGAIVIVGHGQDTTENWESELVPAYETILGSVHRAP